MMNSCVYAACVVVILSFAYDRLILLSGLGLFTSFIHSFIRFADLSVFEPIAFGL